MSTFIMLSGVPYDSMKQRPQHLADALVRLGHNVIFIALNHHKELPKETLVQMLANKVLLESVAQEQFPGLLSLRHLCYRENDYLLGFDLVLEYLERECEDPIFYVGYPDAVSHLNRLSEQTTIIYDCMDDWAQFAERDLANHKSGQYLASLERRMALSADLVVTTSIRLYAKLASYAERIGYLPNTVRKKDFAVEPKLPNDLQHIPHPIVIFVGALHNWVDFELIAYLAEQRPCYSYVIVGPNHELSQSPRADNIYYLGEKPYIVLPHYLKQARAAIIPFKVDKLTTTVNPVKFHEYLSAGVLTVTTAFPDLVGFPGSFMASGYEDFLAQLDYIISMDDCDYAQLAAKGMEAISQFDWDLSARLIADWAMGKSSPPNVKQQLTHWTQKLEGHLDKDVVISQLIMLYNLCSQYTEAIRVGDVAHDMGLLDHEQLALAHLRLGQYEQALDHLRCYFSSKEEDSSNYLKRLQSHEQSMLLIEILILKCCNRHLEAATLLSSVLSSGSEDDPLILGLLLELNLELAEVEQALLLAAKLIDLVGLKTLVEILSLQGVLHLVWVLIMERWYLVAEELLLELDADPEPNVGNLLGELYLAYYTFEHGLGSKDRT